jgi:hypothetical protein
MTQTITIREGQANVFVAMEHANSEVVPPINFLRHGSRALGGKSR